MSKNRTQNKNRNGKAKAKRDRGELVTKVEESSIQPHQFRIGFDQSVSSGVIAIKGEVLFNSENSVEALVKLTSYLGDFEALLKNQNYMIATDHAPKKSTNGITV